MAVETTTSVRDRLAARLLTAVGWLVAAPLLLVAAARILAWDARSSLAVLNALTPVLYLPAWPVALVAGLARRWVLFGAAATVVAAHVAFVLPEVAAREALPPQAGTAPAFRLFSANVFEDNPRIASFAREIARARPDMVLLQEATPRIVSGLDASGVLAGLPHRLVVPRPDPMGAFVASRWPLEETEVVEVRGRPIALAATIRPFGEPIRVVGVHALSPVGEERRPEWVADLHHLTEMAAAERRPLLLAGDFNASWGHRAFRRLLDRGDLTDAAAARGHPFRMTWSRSRPILPPLVRIDHVLTKGGLVVTSIDTGEGRGSDHRPLVAEVAVLGPSR